jgi:hypothetical protein
MFGYKVEKCIKKINTDEVEDLVYEMAAATFTNIIPWMALNEIAQSKQATAGGSTGGLTILPAAVRTDGWVVCHVCLLQK